MAYITSKIIVLRNCNLSLKTLSLEEIRGILQDDYILVINKINSNTTI